MRLIDVDSITDEQIIEYLGLRYASCACDVRDMLNEQPTAYDLSEVLTRLNTYFEENEKEENSGFIEVCTYIVEEGKINKIQEDKNKG